MALTKVKTDVIVSLDAAKITGLLSAIDGTNLDNVSVGSDQVSRNNLALNVFEDSVRHNMDRLSLSQGWVDTFEDADDVDGGRHYNIPMTYFSNTPTNSTNTVYLSQDANQFGSSGWADSQKLMFSFYMSVDFDSDSSNSNDMDMITCGSNNYVLIRREGYEQTNKIHVQLKNASSQVVVRARSTKTVLRSDGVVHVLISLDTTQSDVAKRFQMIITESDGTKHSGIDTSFGGYVAPVQNGIVKLTDKWGIATPAGATGGGTTFFKGSLGQIFSAEDAMDISDDNNYGIFYSPNDFGNGEVPFGTTDKVRIHLKNQYPTFRTGTGQGSFIQQGNLELVDGGYANDETYSSKSFSNSYEVVDSYGMENQNGTRSLGDSGRNAQKNAQCITLSSEEIITKVGIYTKGDSNPVNNCWVEIQGVTGTVGTNAVPNNNIIAKTNEVPASSVSTSFTLVYFTFEEPVVLAAGDYSIVFNCEEVSTGFMHGGHDNTPNHSGNQAESNSSGSWSMNSSWDNIYYLYGQKNLDLITKGSDDIGNSPSVAPDKGHMEVLIDDRISDLTISDISSSSHNINTTAGTTNVIKTADNNAPKTHSLFFSGSSKLRITRTSDFDFGTSPVTIEFWTKCSNPQNDRMISCGSHPNEWFIRSNSQAGEAVKATFDGGTPEKMTFGSNLWADGNWHHLALVRNDDTLKLYVDGTVPSGGTITGLSGKTWSIASGQDIGIGSGINGGSTEYYSGNLDEIRISRAALYTSNFTPSTAPFTSNASTVLLISPSTFSYTYPTLNTGGDIIGQMSRDGGSTWDDVSLTRTETQVSGTSRNLLGGEVTFAATTGTNIVGRVKTANKDKITVHGISVNWS